MLDHGYQSTPDMIVIGAFAGLRIGEIVKVAAADINWIMNTIRSIRKSGLDHIVRMPPAVQEVAH
ncbi:MAG: hypothetical protein ACTHWB_06860 [Microbacterium gubbeenense]|uniref:hypothetical protein n=1 Tax=Microbacterium gubbeenense TaxID=159896 RepID=UPI003F97CDCC